MADGIRIDDLDPTVLPNLDHVLPAMLDGMTVKLTIRQIRALMSGGTDAALALADLSNTTGPRGKAPLISASGGDFNNSFENGWWVFGPGQLNAPEPTKYYILQTIVESLVGNNCIQYAFGYGVDSSSDSFRWKRECNVGSWTAWYRVRESEDEILALVAADPWALQPIGTITPLLTHLIGIAEPPADKPYRYAKLSAGYTGAGQYNNGVLTSESVSGSWPTILATATISLAGSPLNGQAIRLINTEGRFLRAGDVSGTLQDSQNQAHSHVVTDPGHVHNLATYVWNAPATLQWTSGVLNSAGLVSGTESASTGISLQSSGGDETRPRNMSVTYYMRVK